MPCESSDFTRTPLPPPLYEWEEDALSPVLDNVSSTKNSENVGKNKAELRGACVKTVFKTLLLLDEGVDDNFTGGVGASGDVNGRDNSGTEDSGREYGREKKVRSLALKGGAQMQADHVQVPRTVFETYWEQMSVLEDGLRLLRANYIRKEEMEAEIRACQDMWAQKLYRLKNASDLHVSGLQHEVDQLHSRVMVLENENKSLKETSVGNDVVVQRLQARVQELTKTTTHDHEAVAKVYMEAHMKIQKLSDNLKIAVQDLEERHDYFDLKADNERLKALIADTASSVTSAVELRAETIRQLVEDNDELASKVTSMGDEIRETQRIMQEEKLRASDLETQLATAHIHVP